MDDFILRTNQFEPILLNKAIGSWIWDIEGKKYLDCESGMWCVNLGHNHPKVIQAIKSQVDEIIHRNKNFLTPITLEAAEYLLKFFPNKYDKLTFLNSGTEAMEFGINFAQKVTKRKRVLSLQDSYLGAYGIAKTLSYTSSEGSQLKIPYPVCNLDNCNCLQTYQPIIDRIFQNFLSEIACFILEPVMVSGGIFRPCKEFIKYICTKVRQSGGLIMVDEVTTGMGRTGQKFGYEFYEIIPDVVILGKALGNGYPISAIITSSYFESKLSSSDLYHVQSHQLDPLGAAIVKSVVNVYIEEKIIERSKVKSQKIKHALLNMDNSFIKEIRSYGMIFGIHITSDKRRSSEDIILEIKNRLLNSGIIIGFNLRKDVLRLLPPLNIQDSEIVFLEEKIRSIFEFLKSNTKVF
ncbi:MAG: aspartate aminotransferase family protein [Candidatus Lokiarchaeota archaeon]|nr:aspartate aminotransferase family protein [Candidatus Lokiarchaeota archaeon]